ncbi:hypothetical protein D4764_18G0008920 [Takifugu flavidus]|uniref:Immunoglobulin C1-set domain-containing protein n=1 Tax=Takifugu flavidus TaxID=433684 RepID=A0A5C6NSL8_9TELE|nr:hypothetical protein D4764_18G0008920 [Takifugu flavidus]
MMMMMMMMMVMMMMMMMVMVSPVKAVLMSQCLHSSVTLSRFLYSCVYKLNHCGIRTRNQADCHHEQRDLHQHSCPQADQTFQISSHLSILTSDWDAQKVYTCKVSVGSQTAEKSIKKSECEE